MILKKRIKNKLKIFFEKWNEFEKGNKKNEVYEYKTMVFKIMDFHLKII